MLNQQVTRDGNRNRKPPAAGLRDGEMQQDVMYAEDLGEILTKVQQLAVSYANNRPGTVAVACLCAGFVLGWKLKPW